jgi:hypothetical protein
MALLRVLVLHSVLSYYAAAAVTIIPLTSNLPRPYESVEAPVTSDTELLLKLHAGTRPDSPIILSNYALERVNNVSLQGVYTSHDSFVRGAIDAGAKHQHFVIQPQDVWLTILKQLSAYLRKHKDDVDVSAAWDNLDGKTTGPPMSANFLMNSMDTWMKTQFDLRSKVSWMADWVHPNFSTVSNPDQPLVLANTSAEMLANGLMMASSSSATERLPDFPCENGLPSITLSGTKEDWQNILTKIDSLAKFGKEPKIYGRLLSVVLSRFIATFDKPNDPAIRLFWSNIVTTTLRQKLCRTTDLVTGWINAFHMWDGAGNLAITANLATSEALQLDGVTFPWRHCKDLPTFYSHAPMCMAFNNPGWVGFSTLRGMLAKHIEQGKPQDYDAAMKLAGFTLPSSVTEKDHSMLKPLPIWITHADDKVIAL